MTTRCPASSGWSSPDVPVGPISWAAWLLVALVIGTLTASCSGGSSSDDVNWTGYGNDASEQRFVP